jgi:hypothetical protein
LRKLIILLCFIAPAALADFAIVDSQECICNVPTVTITAHTSGIHDLQDGIPVGSDWSRTTFRLYRCNTLLGLQVDPADNPTCVKLDEKDVNRGNSVNLTGSIFGYLGQRWWYLTATPKSAGSGDREDLTFTAKKVLSTARCTCLPGPSCVPQ